jgi:spermidine synthase
MIPDGRSWRVTAVIVGAISAGTQVVLLREVLSIFLGNELVIGIMLFDWLALTGVGALLIGPRVARLRMTLILPALLGSLLILSPLTLIGFQILPLIVAPVGSMLEIWIFLVGAVLVLAPVCFASGAAFASLVRLSSANTRSIQTGAVYAWEGLGSLIGGLLFGVLLFDLVGSWDLIIILCVSAGIVGAILSLRISERQAAIILAVIASGLVISWFALDVDGRVLQVRYPAQVLVAHKETPFGILTATRSGDQTSVFVNNVPVFISHDPQNDEEAVHLTLAQRRAVHKVLIVGGNPAGLVPEVLKYSGVLVECIEENRWLREVQRMELPFPENARTEYREVDLRSLLDGRTGFYDAMVLVVPEPASLQSNRMYTRELFVLVHRSLARGGVLCLSLPSSGDYAGDDARNVRAILRNTLGTVFDSVRVFPMGRDLFLASDSTIRQDVASAIAETGVPTLYANPGYIQDDLLAARIARMDANLRRATPINTDSLPVLMLAQIRYWLRFFTAQSWLPVLLFVALLLFAIRTDRITFGMMSAGCGGIVLELMVLMIIQVEFGNVYKAVGGFIGLYMAGMSLGAYLGGRLTLSARTYGLVQSGLGLSLMVLPLMQSCLAANTPLAVGGLIATVFVGSLCAGAVFALTARMGKHGVVRAGAHLYAVDLLGSAIGALFIGPVVLPLLGVQATADLATSVVLVGAFVTLTTSVWRGYEKA